MSNLTIQPATRDQAEAIAALIREAFHREIAILGLNPQDHPYHGAYETAANVRRRMQQGTVAVAEPVGAEEQPAGQKEGQDLVAALEESLARARRR